MKSASTDSRSSALAHSDERLAAVSRLVRLVRHLEDCRYSRSAGNAEFYVESAEKPFEGRTTAIDADRRCLPWPPEPPVTSVQMAVIVAWPNQGGVVLAAMKDSTFRAGVKLTAGRACVPCGCP